MVWLPSYAYRKKGSAVATAAGAQTNYQKQLLVGESSGAVGEAVDCEEHCQDFPKDIRFTGADGLTKHDYWVESLTGNTPNRLATIWVEIASIPAFGDVDLYMYYGKTSDSGESNGDNTFEFFDDFEGTELDTIPTSGAVAVSADGGKYEAWPGIAKAANGDLFVVYRTCDSNTHGYESTGRIVIRKSTDDGQSWGSEVVVANEASPFDDRNAGILIFDDDGTETILVVYNVSDNTVANDRACCRKSVNHGANWGSKIELSSGNTRYTWNPPILLSNGKILVPIYDVVGTKTYVVESNDGGDNWTEYTVTTSYGSEFSIIETKTGANYTGGIYGLIRDDSSPYIYKKVTSTDYGHTWSAVTDETDFSDPYATPITFHRAPNGELLAVYTKDTGNLLEIYESTDEGSNWTYKTTVVCGASISYYPCLETISSTKLIVVWCVNGATSDVYVNFLDYPLSVVAHRWVIDNGAVTVANSEVILNETDQIRNPKKRSHGLQWRSKINYVNTTDYIMIGMAEEPGNLWHTHDSFLFQTLIVGKDYPTCYNNGSYTQNDTHEGASGDHIYGVKWKTGEIKWYYDDAIIDTFTTNIPDEPIWTKFDNRTGIHKVDWVMISKYASPEPDWGTWNGEEEGARSRSYAFIIG